MRSKGGREAHWIEPCSKMLCIYYASLFCAQLLEWLPRRDGLMAKILGKKLRFSRDSRLGFLTFCPTNLGTTIRASVHIKLPKLASDKTVLDSTAAKYNLQVRGGLRGVLMGM
ncbi:hypothetical protein HPB51_027519 [Rhipicephalus microplus]|uniref:arginine kinase n=1 Tax=Rhipicephalus microplus TaxID=6941 RepID=A0A9J6D021_RHIMP|nr:hypothetical protein HPB51_027519 [Rhipicephalus microplus]